MPTARRMTTPPISERRPRVVRGSTTSSEKPHRFLIVLFGLGLWRALSPDVVGRIGAGAATTAKWFVWVAFVAVRMIEPRLRFPRPPSDVRPGGDPSPCLAEPNQRSGGLRGSPAQAVARRRARHVLTPRRSEYDLGVSDPDPVARHLHAARTHDQAAERHDEAARYWAERGDQVKADLEQRNAVIERDAAQLERDRAAAEQR